MRKNCVYAFFIGLLVCAQGAEALAKDGEGSRSLSTESVAANTSTISDQFQWNDHKHLSWDDFRGPVRPLSGETAAATHCAIGFKVQPGLQGSSPTVQVYNKFYTNQSWVRSDARIPSILEHEQGHFDLCEIYTRKLRVSLNNFDLNVPDAKNALMAIYTQVSNAYESRQQAYEQETAHGTKIDRQKEWSRIMQQELLADSYAALP